MTDTIHDGDRHSPPLLSLRSPSHPRRRRPCDRCHAIKERCRWPTDDADVCERCTRLKFGCHSDRPMAKAGRKPRLAVGDRLPLRRKCPPSGRRHSTLSSSSDQSFASSPSESASSPRGIVSVPGHQHELRVPQGPPLFPELSSLELHFLDIILCQQIEVDKYLIGPSFRERHLQAFADHLKAGMPLLKDAFIACAPLLTENQELQHLAQGQQVSHKRAAAAISSLRLLEVHNDHDLPMVLILGMIMVTFALHHSGGEALLCSYILGLVKPLYEHDSSFTRRLGPDGLSFLICLLGTETSICLVRSRTPTLKMKLEDTYQLVDRFIGVSAAMMTHFYDICKLAHGVGTSGCRRGSVLMDRTLQESLDNLEQVVDSWQPTVPADFLCGRYPLTDVTLMLAQAKVLRFTALIILHRLRYAYGSQDGKAAAMSNAILKELDLIVELTSRSVPFGDLAYLVACFEITKPSERQAVLTKCPRIVDFSSHVRQELTHWIVTFWSARDDENSHSIYWEGLPLYLGD